jgi:cytochrome c oxidase subunit 2
VVRGTQAAGDLGPDLTHFADRLTLGAGIAPNTSGHLSAWVINPHSMKEGNIMPATNLSDEDLAALLAYLEALQ